MKSLTQKTVAIAADSTLSLLFLTAGLGSGEHRQVLIHRRGDRIVEACDYSADALSVLLGEMRSLAQVWSDMAEDCPTQRLRAKWAISSSGDVAIELIAENAILTRTPVGDWTIHSQNPVNTHDENAVDSPPTFGSALTATTSLALV